MSEQASAFRCQQCESAACVVVYEGLPDRLSGHAGRFDYVQCAACGLIQLRDIPGNLAAYYEDYRLHRTESPLYQLFRQLILGRCYPLPRGPGRCLDVGCGSGWYLKAMQRRGWQPVGYERDPAAAADLTQRLGLPVIGDEAELERHVEAFDLVTMHFSLEHLDQPRRLLPKVLRTVKRDGRLLIAVPNIEGREARLFGGRWFHLDPPRHTTFFTKSALTTLLADHGFGRIQVRDLGVPTGFAGSLSYALCGRFHPLLWYAGILPGMVFCRLVPDGNFQISATKE